MNSSGIVLIRLVFQFQNNMFCFLISPRKQTSQRTTKLTIRLVWSANTQIRLRRCAGSSETWLIARVLYSLRAIQRWINENACCTGWMYRLIWVCLSHGSYCRYCHALAHIYLTLRIAKIKFILVPVLPRFRRPYYFHCNMRKVWLLSKIKYFCIVKQCLKEKQIN